MNKFKKTLLKLYLDHPFDFNLYLDGYNNKDYAYKVIKSFIPTDTGIEWEIGPNMVDVITNKDSFPWMPRLTKDSDFEVTYRVNQSRLNRQLRQLDSLYSFMSKSIFSDRRQENSGIHIHTNLINFDRNKHSAMQFLIHERDYADKAVKRIANNFFHYGGSYNTLRFDWSKGNAIIYRSNYNTIEYRCINMTWNFRELLKYIIVCHCMTNLFLQYGSHLIDGDTFLSKVDDYISLIKEL